MRHWVSYHGLAINVAPDLAHFTGIVPCGVSAHGVTSLKDLGVTILGPRAVAQTDHVSFDNVGLPAFQFLVDRLEYNSRTHHSNMDVYDRVQRDDMVQQATVIAVFAFEAATADEKLPRKALPAPQRPAGRGTTSSAQR